MRRSSRAARAAVASLVASAVVLAGALSAQAAIQVQHVSRTSGDVPVHGDSTTKGGASTVSGDGHLVAFRSEADNLRPADPSWHIFVRNLDTGKTLWVDLNSGTNFGPAISANGRLTAFYGTGQPDPNGINQVWVHDLKTGQTRLASRANNGHRGNGSSLYPSLSGDGRFVAFQSTATNLPGGDGVDSMVYVRDLKLRRTILVSKTNGSGSPAHGKVYGQSLPSGGGRVVFYSKDPDLPGGDPTTFHVYLRNLETGHTALVDRAANGHRANGDGADPSISDSGRFVAFESVAANLGSSVTHNEVYLRDLRNDTTRMASRNNAGHAGNGDAHYPHPSGDGRYVVFSAQATNLPGGNASFNEIYGRGMQERNTLLLSRAANGDPANGNCDYPSISRDGRWAAFYCGADNLQGRSFYDDVYRAGPIG